MQQHYAEICGCGGGGGGAGAPPSVLLAPWTLSRLAAVLASSQNEFEVFMDAEATSSSLNLSPDLGDPWQDAPLGPDGGGGERDEKPRGVSADEVAEWPSGARRLAGRYVRQLKYCGGTFSARLGAP